MRRHNAAAASGCKRIRLHATHCAGEALKTSRRLLEGGAIKAESGSDLWPRPRRRDKLNCRRALPCLRVRAHGDYARHFHPYIVLSEAVCFHESGFGKTTADSGQPNTDTPIGTLTQCVASIAQKKKKNL